MAMRDRVFTVLRLAALFLAIALTTSRLTLVLHELVGHGAMVKAVGAELLRYHLFWFAGGFVEFTRAEPYTLAEEMAIFLGGITLEIALGVMVFLIARRTRPGSIARIGLFGYAAIVLVHAGYYLTAGTFHGFGDGQILYREMGDARLALVLPVTAFVLVAAHAMARHWVAHVASRLPATGPPLLTIAIAVVLAAGGHAALSFGELAIRPDLTYENTMRHESEHAVEHDLAIFIKAIEMARGEQPADHELSRRRHELRETHGDFPFSRVFIAMLAVAILTGVRRSRTLRLPATRTDPAPEVSDDSPAVESDDRSIQWRDVAIPGALTAASLVLIAVLKLLQ